MSRNTNFNATVEWFQWIVKFPLSWEKEAKVVTHVDLIVLAHNPGGKERTEKEFEALAKGVGFQGFQVMCCAFNTYIMEFIKKALSN
jgi:hypothetical protein